LEGNILLEYNSLDKINDELILQLGQGNPK